MQLKSELPQWHYCQEKWGSPGEGCPCIANIDVHGCQVGAIGIGLHAVALVQRAGPGVPAQGYGNLTSQVSAFGEKSNSKDAGIRLRLPLGKLNNMLSRFESQTQ